MQEVPRLEIPLHTLIELVPKPDGKMAEERIKFDLQHESVASYLNQTSSMGSLATQDSMQVISQCTCTIYCSSMASLATQDSMQVISQCTCTIYCKTRQKCTNYRKVLLLA